MMDTLQHVLAQFGMDIHTSVVPFGSGLINHTWRVQAEQGEFILQRVNDKVFSDPEAIDHNIRMIAEYLAIHAPGYLFVAPLPAANGQGLVYVGDGYYRMFPFIKGSHAKEVVTHAHQAFEAAAQFGRFTRLLSGFDAGSLKITLPSFHDLSLRYRQFLDALNTGNPARISESAELIETIKANKGIVDVYESILVNPSFKKRVTHHDTKISNVLFNGSDEALCVIDLDTVMPGYFISDIGDMMRTYLSTVSEEESDFSKIAIRDDVYRSIVVGYFAEMEDELSAEECQYFFYAGTFMIYMQALRFLTDYLNNDVYYGAAYHGQNLIRAGNQAVLLQRLQEKAAELTLQ